MFDGENKRNSEGESEEIRMSLLDFRSPIVEIVD
jgi:hypothetical protein